MILAKYSPCDNYHFRSKKNGRSTVDPTIFSLKLFCLTLLYPQLWKNELSSSIQQITTVGFTTIICISPVYLRQIQCLWLLCKGYRVALWRLGRPPRYRHLP